ncbi:EPM2A-interacting protein 1-like [Octopus bimaculoides]|uniref:EPM2A-interacting protein 1-like n=1 Tax=Octopus bimaculoides TaxID=37653 RepID=UPI00071D0665|nr:EPM2A-interacting protein 1-like [Octopus bimaculoides]|eukprot:XP_014780231.1 PREDICTED: EPM2A-interacting protein 1-like [Octopus bimaculoides]
MLAELNLHLQGKDQLCCSMFERITSFPKKLELYIIHLKGGEIVHFQNLSERQEEVPVNFEKYTKLCEALLDARTRFSNSRNIETELKLLSDPFSFIYVEAPAKYQLELIEDQSRESLKIYLDFYKKLHSFNELYQIANLARKLLCTWNSTYCCEQFFSSMENIKTAKRNKLSDCHLTNILRVKNSTTKSRY